MHPHNRHNVSRRRFPQRTAFNSRMDNGPRSPIYGDRQDTNGPPICNALLPIDPKIRLSRPVLEDRLQGQASSLRRQNAWEERSDPCPLCRDPF